MTIERRWPNRYLAAPGHSFSDLARKVVSIINLESLADLERTTGRSLHPLRFRANLYVEGMMPWSELRLVGRRLTVGACELKVVKPTSRCAATEVNPDTAERDIDVPDALARHTGDIDCGIYAEVTRAGRIAEGDAIIIGEGLFDARGLRRDRRHLGRLGVGDRGRVGWRVVRNVVLALHGRLILTGAALTEAPPAAAVAPAIAVALVVLVAAVARLGSLAALATAAGDERRQANVALRLALIALKIRLRLGLRLRLMLRLGLVRWLRLGLRLVLLMLRLLKGRLLILLMPLRLLTLRRRHRRAAGIRLATGVALVAVAVEIVAVAALLGLLILLMRILLTELRLRRGDEAEIVLGVLQIAFRRDGIARGLRIARELHILLGDVVGGAPDLHVGAVRLVHARQRIVTAATAAAAAAIAGPHALLLSVSHRRSILRSLGFKVSPPAAAGDTQSKCWNPGTKRAAVSCIRLFQSRYRSRSSSADSCPSSSRRGAH